jgi:dynein heavy chain
VRVFDAYRQLEEQVKALLTSLPLVSDLHNPSMRERHWKQLMKATNKHFVLDENFSLGNMLALSLHECVDVVSETVERAQKELVIEKALTKIEDTWVGLQVSFHAFGAGSEVRRAAARRHCVNARSPGALRRCSTSLSTRWSLRRSRTTTWRCRT